MNPQQPSIFEMAMPFIIVIGVFYLFIIRPQSKKMKEQQDLQSSLKRGDEVVTQSGFLGTIEGLTDQFVTLEIASNVKVKVLRKQILGLQSQVLNSASPNDNRVESRADKKTQKVGQSS